MWRRIVAARMGYRLLGDLITLAMTKWSREEPIELEAVDGVERPLVVRRQRQPHRARTRIAVDLDPRKARRLKALSSRTGQPLWRIVEAALDEHFDDGGEDEPKKI